MLKEKMKINVQLCEEEQGGEEKKLPADFELKLKKTSDFLFCDRHLEGKIYSSLRVNDQCLI